MPFRALPPGRRVAEYAVSTIGRVLDVAVLTPDGTLVGAIEVRHRHACDDVKLSQLCDLLGDRLPSLLRCVGTTSRQKRKPARGALV